MESKVIMYDAGGAEVGETYTRRARQLVKQQRAVWADETHTAIRFAPDTAEEWEPEPIPAPAAPPAPTAPIPARTGSLYALAEKRVRDRRRIILHTVALIPVFIILLIWGVTSYNARRGGEMFLIVMAFGWGVWITSYIAHLRNYVKMSGYIPRPGSWEARRKITLDVEVDRLRRMGYTE